MDHGVERKRILVQTCRLAHLSVGRSVCLSVVCNVLYCGKTVRPSEKLSEGNQGQKVDFLGRRHFSTSGFSSTVTKTAVFALLLPIQTAIGTRWYKWTF